MKKFIVFLWIVLNLAGTAAGQEYMSAEEALNMAANNPEKLKQYQPREYMSAEEALNWAANRAASTSPPAPATVEAPPARSAPETTRSAPVTSSAPVTTRTTPEYRSYPEYRGYQEYPSYPIYPSYPEARTVISPPMYQIAPVHQVSVRPVYTGWPLQNNPYGASKYYWQAAEQAAAQAEADRQEAERILAEARRKAEAERKAAEARQKAENKRKAEAERKAAEDKRRAENKRKAEAEQKATAAKQQTKTKHAEEIPEQQTKTEQQSYAVALEQEKMRHAQKLLLIGVVFSIPLTIVIGFFSLKILSELRLLLQDRRNFQLEQHREQRAELEVAQKIIDSDYK